jgi:hypothetical protein
VPDRRSWLHHLDENLLPPVRRALRAVGGVVAAPPTALTRWERAGDRPAPVRAVAAHPAVVALLAGVVVFAGSLLHLQRFDDAGRDRGAATGEQPVTGPGEQAPPEVGPRVGADVELYAEGRRELLADLDAAREIRAMVSFVDYLSADELSPAAGIELEVLHVRVPVTDEPPQSAEVGGEDPETVATDLVEAEIERLEEEEQELRSLLDSDVDDPEFEEEYERRADELAETREALEDEAAIVFAVTVVGTVDVLLALQDEQHVRLVDPVGAVPETRATRLYGLLPEDLDRASHGRAL